MAAKSNAAHVELRVDQICRMFANGALPGDVKRYGTEEWGISGRQVDSYIAKARIKLRESIAGIDRPDYMAQHIATLHTILRNSLKDRNWSCALGATAQLARITGVEKP
jgi:hypothetical protein